MHHLYFNVYFPIPGSPRITCISIYNLICFQLSPTPALPTHARMVDSVTSSRENVSPTPASVRKVSLELTVNAVSKALCDGINTTNLCFKQRAIDYVYPCVMSNRASNSQQAPILKKIISNCSV